MCRSSGTPCPGDSRDGGRPIRDGHKRGGPRHGRFGRREGRRSGRREPERRCRVARPGLRRDRGGRARGGEERGRRRIGWREASGAGCPWLGCRLLGWQKAFGSGCPWLSCRLIGWREVSESRHPWLACGWLGWRKVSGSARPLPRCRLLGWRKASGPRHPWLSCRRLGQREAGPRSRGDPGGPRHYRPEAVRRRCQPARSWLPWGQRRPEPVRHRRRHRRAPSGHNPTSCTPEHPHDQGNHGHEPPRHPAPATTDRLHGFSLRYSVAVWGAVAESVDNRTRCGQLGPRSAAGGGGGGDRG